MTMVSGILKQSTMPSWSRTKAPVGRVASPLNLEMQREALHSILPTTFGIGPDPDSLPGKLDPNNLIFQANKAIQEGRMLEPFDFVQKDIRDGAILAASIGTGRWWMKPAINTLAGRNLAGKLLTTASLASGTKDLAQAPADLARGDTLKARRNALSGLAQVGYSLPIVREWGRASRLANLAGKSKTIRGVSNLVGRNAKLLSGTAYAAGLENYALGKVDPAWNTPTAPKYGPLAAIGTAPTTATIPTAPAATASKGLSYKEIAAIAAASGLSAYGVHLLLKRHRAKRKKREAEEQYIQE